MAASNLVWGVFGVLAGATIALQAPLNAQLARSLGSPVGAAAVSFVAGAVVLVALAAVLILWNGRPSGAQDAPPWLYAAGGCLGAFYVTCAIVLTPRLGAAALMGLAIAGQLAAGLVLDHFGLLGLAVREISLGRVIGAGLLIAGALLIRFA